MSNLSEKEIIKILTAYLLANIPDIITQEEFDKVKQAIQGLLDLYNKEKEKNKELEKENKILTQCNNNIYATTVGKAIIREKIEEIKKDIKRCKYREDDTEEYKKDMQRELGKLYRVKAEFEKLLEEK